MAGTSGVTIRRFALGPLDNNTYLVRDEATGEAALIDPSFDSETLLPDVTAPGTILRYILNTHAHFDHIVGNAFFSEQTNAPIALHRDDLTLLRDLPQHGQRFGFDLAPSPEPTLFLEHGQTLMLGETPIMVRFTPGHAPGHVVFVLDNAVIAGDTLFQNSIGRTDLPGGSLTTLLDSIERQLLTLPDDTQVLPGHGKPTTIGAERRSNLHLRGLGKSRA